MTLQLLDLFCGGGGSSTGAIEVPDLEVAFAANHWDLAIEVHNSNHPDADHAAVDLHEENPAYFGGPGRFDVLWASPECTKWSQASGGKYKNVSDGDDLLDHEIARAMDLVDDAHFRMLEPSEVAHGMAFPRDYKWAGTRRQRVKLAGNAVTPPAARDLLHPVAAALGAAA